jgi:hypothetical protein
MKETPNRWGSFDDKKAALVSQVLTAAFKFAVNLRKWQEAKHEPQNRDKEQAGVLRGA